MKSVIVGIDRSKTCRHALKFALKRARANSWRVAIVHVINWSKYSFPTLEENERRPAVRRREAERAQTEIIEPLLDWAHKKGLLDGIEVNTAVHFGRPSEVLSELAYSDEHDAIIVARTGDSQLKTAIFGSTANRLVQHATVPVVVVP